MDGISTEHVVFNAYYGRRCSCISTLLFACSAKVMHGFFLRRSCIQVPHCGGFKADHLVIPLYVMLFTSWTFAWVYIRKWGSVAIFGKLHGQKSPKAARFNLKHTNGSIGNDILLPMSSSTLPMTENAIHSHSFKHEKGTLKHHCARQIFPPLSIVFWMVAWRTGMGCW